MASKCGEQFYRRYIRGEKRPPKSFLISGSAVDRGVTVDLENKLDEGQLASEEDVKSATRDYVEHADWSDIEREDDEVGKSDQQLKDETKDKAVRLISAHHQVIAPTITPVPYGQGKLNDRIKHPFSVNLDKWLRGRAQLAYEDADHYTGWAKRVRAAHARALNAAARQGFDFVGERDIVEKLGGYTAVRDTKTSKKSPTLDIAEKSHQLTAYALASQVLEGKIPDALILDYLVDLKYQAKASSYRASRDQVDLDIYLNRIEQTIVSLITGNFAPAPEAAWWCDPRYCGYYSTCRYVRNRKLVQITTDLEGK
jgi:hypothetical protein